LPERHRRGRDVAVRSGGRKMMTLVVVLGAALTMPPGDAKPAERLDDVKRRGQAACVRVNAEDAGRTGTGVAIGKKGVFVYVLTASHVVSGSRKIEISPAPTPGAKATTWRDVELIVDAPEQDVALLRVAAGETPLGVAL